MCFFVFGKSINVGVALFLKGSALFLPFHLPPLFYCATIVTLYHNKVNRQSDIFLKNRKCRLPEEIQRFQKKQRGVIRSKNTECKATLPSLFRNAASF